MNGGAWQATVHGIAESNMTEGTLHNASLFQAVKIASDSPGGQVVKNLPANAGDMDWIPGLEDPTGPEATKPVSHCYAQSPSPQN